MAVVIVATAVPIPEYRDEVVSAFEAAVEKVHATEDECLIYALHESADGKLVMIEKYADQAAINRHVTGIGLSGLVAAVKDKLTLPIDIQVLKPHPAGLASKGRL
jgi:quinol monooxygenase YgiN